MTSRDDDLDPRHVFLSAGEVIERYRWGLTRGYANLKNREITPPPVVTHPTRWRLDQLMAWEERRMSLANEEWEELPKPRSAPQIADLLPQPKRAGRPRSRSA